MSGKNRKVSQMHRKYKPDNSKAPTLLKKGMSKSVSESKTDIDTCDYV